MKSDNQDDSCMIPVGHIEMKPLSETDLTVDNDALPIIPTRNLVLFPGVIIPLHLIRANALNVAREAHERHEIIGIVCQINPEEEKPSADNLSLYGVYGEVMQVIPLPDDTHTAIVRAHGKFKLLHEVASGRISSEITMSVKPVREMNPRRGDTEFEAVCSEIKTIAKELSNDELPGGPVEMIFNLNNQNTNPADLVNNLCTHAPIEIQKKMALLSLYRLKDRAKMLLQMLLMQREMKGMLEEVRREARESFDDQQRRAFLQRQLEVIDRELNGEDSDIARLREKAASMDLPENVRTHFEKEVDKLSRISQQTPDYNVQLSYLETLLSMPWGKVDKINSNFTFASTTLDYDHYGLEKVKERMLEQIAVILQNPEGHAPILCLVGPPGVGKTSLGRSVATALHLRYGRVSLGGLSDEAEIRGHRRTYIGAMPGRIVDGIRRSGSMNPLIVLDEIDKIGKDYKGDPSSALLEVLDPEQNCKFHDNYMDVDIDLSKVTFIATANTLSTVPQPLLDRMEIIEISGYAPEEKVQIARLHLLEKISDDLNIAVLDDYNITDEAIAYIIERYTSESGVRQLERMLKSIVRKLIMKRMKKEVHSTEIGIAEVKDLLGVEKFNKEANIVHDVAGVATGLAWTAAGGEILFIESLLTPGKGEKLILTGQLGDVMKESAMIALQYVRAHATDLGIDSVKLTSNDLHVHVPEGAIPKDGPSAGITIATSIASAFTGVIVKPGLAMTGELTLLGRVLPVGGIKEKILAARRAGIKEIILCEDNRRDILDIENRYTQGMTFHYVKHISVVFEIALDK